MLVLGTCVSYQATKPVITAVALSGDRAAPTLERQFDLRSSAADLVDQLDDLARQLRSQLQALKPDRIVIRLADTSKIANNVKAPRERLMIEGAMAFACREFVATEVYLRTGKENGQVLGVSKEDAMAKGAELDSKRREAAAAALSGLE